MEFTSKNFDRIIKELVENNLDFMHVKILNNKIFNVHLSDQNNKDLLKDSEYVLWVLKKITSIKKLFDREFFVVFSDMSIISINTFTLKNYVGSKYTFPSQIDHMRIKNNVFGIDDMNNMKWFDKENVFLALKNNEVIKHVRHHLRHHFVEQNENDNGFKSKFIVCTNLDDMSTLLFSGSCIIFVEPNKNIYNWFSDKLIPGTHYISVKNTFSNLNEKVLWCLSNDEMCERIALNARNFSCKELGFSGVANHWFNLITNQILPSANEHGYLYVQYNNQLQYLIDHFKMYSSNERNIVGDLNWNVIVDFGNGKLDYSSLYACKNIINSNQDYLCVMNSLVFEKVYFNQDLYSGINNLFIGVKCVNEMCANVPNFEYTFYGEVMNEPLKIYTDKVNSDSVEDFLIKFPEQSENLLEQLCLCLQLAWERHGFMHGNLNSETVRVVTIKNKIRISYSLDENIYVIETKYILFLRDYSESIVFSSFSMNNKRMVIGNFNRTDEKLTEEKLNDIMHAKGISNLTKFTNKIFGKRLGKILKEDFFGMEYKPKSVLESYVSLEEKVDNKNIEFVSYNPVDTFNCLINKDPKTIVKDVFTNEIPRESTSLGNIILQYELSQNISSSLINCNVNFSVNVISKEIAKILNFFKTYYDRVVEQQMYRENEKYYEDLDEDELWVIKNYIKKYLGPITKSKHGKYILSKVNRILYRSFKELVNVCIFNTLEFQNKSR